MGRKVGAALAAALVLAALSESAAAITNGKLDGNRHPNVGALVAFADELPAGGWLGCSGVLVAPGVYLTAAHCIVMFDGLTNLKFFVNFSPTSDPGSLIPGKATIDPLYGTGPPTDTDPHDLAVVTFDPRAARGIQPAKLPPLGLLDALLKGRTRAHEEAGANRKLRGLPMAAAKQNGNGDQQSQNGNNQQGGNNGNGQGLQFVNVGYGATEAPPTLPDGPPTALDGLRRSSVSGDPALLGDAYLRLSQRGTLGGTCNGDSGGPQFLGPFAVSITITGDIPCLDYSDDLRLDTRTVRTFLAPYVDDLH